MSHFNPEGTMTHLSYELSLVMRDDLLRQATTTRTGRAEPRARRLRRLALRRRQEKT